MASPRSIAVGASVLLAAYGSAQSVLLRYRPPVGKTVSYTLTESTSTSMPQNAGAPMSYGQTVPMSIRVISRKGDSTTIETRTEISKVGAASPMNNGPKAVKDIVMHVTLDQFGNPMDAAGSGATAGTAGGMNLGGQGVVFPAKPVKVGDTWTITFDGSKMMGATGRGVKMTGKIPVDFRLTALSGGVATISMTSKGTLSVTIGAKATQVTIDIRGTTAIDVATGLAKSTSTTTDTKMELPGMGAVDQHITTALN